MCNSHVYTRKLYDKITITPMMPSCTDLSKEEDRIVIQKDTNRKSSIAKGRWNILRDAIRSTSTTTQSSSSSFRPNHHNKSTINQYSSSIHNFIGYQMIPSPQLVEISNDDDDDDVVQLMLRYDCSNGDSSLYGMYQYTIPISTVVATTSSNVDATMIHVYTREKRSMTSGGNNIHQQQQHRITTLQELVCHHNPNHQIDNTGNICVWDSERTLCWFLFHISSSSSSPIQLLQQHHPPLWQCWDPPPSSLSESQNNNTNKNKNETTTTVLELGCGMAGLATLTLAAAIYKYSNNHPQQTHNYQFYMTDGSMDCVRNNEINVSMMRSMNVIPAISAVTENSNTHSTIQIDCCQLLWSYDVPMPENNNNNNNNNLSKMRVADITMVSDCLHFEEYHGELLWTLVTHTQKQAILCQPNRTPSLQNFLTFIDHVNDTKHNKNDHHLGPLIRITEHISDMLNEKHEMFLQQQQEQQNGDDDYYYYYDSDKHRPRIYVMDVLRRPNEEDRHCMMEYTKRSRARP